MQFLQYEIVLFTKLPEGSVSFAVWRPMAADPDVSSPEGSPISFAGLLCVHVHRVRGSLLLGAPQNWAGSSSSSGFVRAGEFERSVTKRRISYWI